MWEIVGNLFKTTPNQSTRKQLKQLKQNNLNIFHKTFKLMSTTFGGKNSHFVENLSTAMMKNMTTKARTVDNLGIDASSRYARDQAQLDKTFIQDSRIIAQKAEISSLTPHIATEFEQYLAPAKQILWATFAAPPIAMADTTLFTHQLIPSLGTSEKQDELIQKLDAAEDTLNKKKRNNKELLELKSIRTALQLILTLDRTLSLINARRNQYQKG
jgi:hypothetical protein